MGTKYKRFYLVTGSILAILAMMTPFVDYYYDYEDEVYCGSDCWATFCIKNGFKNFYYYNEGELPLTFEPSPKSVEFFKKDGRYKSGYRKIDFITPYSKGVKYVFKIPAYSYTCYGMKVKKSPTETIKWTFAGLDPYFIGTNLTMEVNDCYDNVSLGGCFDINWTKAWDQINWSDNTTLKSGNYSWNLLNLIFHQLIIGYLILVIMGTLVS